MLCLAGTLQEEVYRARGLATVTEYYLDLDYTDDGALIITREHPPRDPNEAARRAVRVARDGIATSVGGRDLTMRAESFCLHSDTPNAAEIARAVHAALQPWLAIEVP